MGDMGMQESKSVVKKKIKIQRSSSGKQLFHTGTLFYVERRTLLGKNERTKLNYNQVVVGTKFPGIVMIL